MPIPASLTADVTVSSEAALASQLSAWAANWNGTVPTGKTTSSERVVAVDTTLLNNITLSNLTFPQMVWVRAAGTFTADDCSVKIRGRVDFRNSTRLGFMLMHCVAADWLLDGSDTVGWYRCFFQKVDNTPPGTGYSGSRYALHLNSTREAITCNNTFILHCRIGYAENGMYWDSNDPDNPPGTATFRNQVVENNIFEWVAHDDVKGSTDVDGLSYKRNWASRNRSGSAGKSHHEDHFQPTGGRVSNPVFWGNVLFPDKSQWFGSSGYTDTYQGFFTSNGGQFSNATLEHNFIVSNTGGMKEGDPGDWLGTNIARYNTLLHNGIGGFVCAIQSTNVTTSYNVTMTDNTSARPTGGGTGGIVLPVNAIPPTDWTAADPYFATGRCPRLFDMVQHFEPATGTQTHWNDTGQKVGAYLRMQEIFETGGSLVPGNVGWPVAKPWTEQYNADGGLVTTYDGNYDSDGNNVLGDGGTPPATPTELPPGGVTIAFTAS